MFINLLESFSSLDEEQKNTIYEYLNRFINPIKFYLILLILVLIFILFTNIYFSNKIILLNKET